MSNTHWNISQECRLVGILVCAALTVALQPKVAHAATTVQVGASMRVDAVRLISVPSGTLTFSFGAFDSETSPTDVIGTVIANNNYRTLVRARKSIGDTSSTTWTATNGRSTKPLTDLQCATSGSYNGLSPTSDFVAVSGTPTSSSGTATTMHFKVLLDFQHDGPTSVSSGSAIYDAVVVFTVAQ